MPQKGATIIGSTTLGHTPVGSRVAGLKVDHLITDQWLFPEASAAPQRPPIRAWLELEGKPSHHVRRFQATPASNAQNSVSMATTSTSTNPVAIVEATAVPASAPRRSNVAARRIAWRGVRTFVATMVATALAVS
jgi:hypothetical protein